MNQIRALLTTGPAVLREQTRGLGRKALIKRMVRLRPERNGAQHPEQATKIAVRGLAPHRRFGWVSRPAAKIIRSR